MQETAATVQGGVSKLCPDRIGDFIQLLLLVMTILLEQRFLHVLARRKTADANTQQTSRLDQPLTDIIQDFHGQAKLAGEL